MTHKAHIERQRKKETTQNRAHRAFLYRALEAHCLPFIFPAGCETGGESASSQRDAGSADCRRQCRRRGFLNIRGCKEEEAAAELTLAKAC